MKYNANQDCEVGDCVSKENVADLKMLERALFMCKYCACKLFNATCSNSP